MTPISHGPSAQSPSCADAVCPSWMEEAAVATTDTTRTAPYDTTCQGRRKVAWKAWKCLPILSTSIQIDTDREKVYALSTEAKNMTKNMEHYGASWSIMEQCSELLHRG